MTSKSFINLSLFLKLLTVYQPEGAIHKGPYTCRLTKVWEMNSCEWMVWEALFSQSSDPSPRSWRVITELLLHREGDALTEHSHSWLREASRSRRAQSLITAVRELTTFSLSRTDPWWGACLPARVTLFWSPPSWSPRTVRFQSGTCEGVFLMPRLICSAGFWLPTTILSTAPKYNMKWVFLCQVN